MRTILAVMSHPEANELVARHWQYYERAGADVILGVETEGGGCEWPKQCTFRAVIGERGYVNAGRLPKRLVGILDACLTLGPFDQIAVIEADTIFLRQIPKLLPGMTAMLRGPGTPQYKGKSYYHCPWMFTREAAARTFLAGHNLILAGEIERGYTDRFVGWAVEKYGIPVHQLPMYSRNELDSIEYLVEAKRAIEDGAISVHGVKTAEQLEYITQP